MMGQRVSIETSRLEVIKGRIITLSNEKLCNLRSDLRWVAIRRVVFFVLLLFLTIHFCSHSLQSCLSSPLKPQLNPHFTVLESVLLNHSNVSIILLLLFSFLF